MKYRKKPVVIEAYQTEKEVVIHTLEGDMKANIGDYIITGVNGEQYPCKPDIFHKTYESVSNAEFDHSDNEIIKALECCINDDCDSCPDTFGNCEHNTMRNALDLINRLQADKEKSDKIIEELNEQIEHLVFLNETAKSEARKEFAEAYKDQIKNYTGMFTDEGFYVSFDAVLNAVDFVCERLSEEMG